MEIQINLHRVNTAETLKTPVRRTVYMIPLSRDEIGREIIILMY